jgi:hypothetical protein
MLCVVQKAFGGPGGSVLGINTVIDASEFKNRDALIANRYLRVASADEVASAVEVEEDDAPPAPMPKKLSVKRTKRNRK